MPLAKIGGHPIHQVMIAFPLGLLSTAAIFDVLGLVRATGPWFFVAYWIIAAGIAGGLVASVFGWWDWFNIPANTRAKSLGLMHGLGNGVVLVLFASSWYLRRVDPAHPALLPVMLCFAGFALAGMTGWMGGELVDRLGIGVHTGAHMNAPNSLSGRPANEDYRAPAS